MYRRCGSGLFLFSSASLVVIFFSTDVVCGPPRLAQASAGQDNCNNLSRQSKILLSVVVISSVVIVKPWSQGWLIAAGAYPGFCSIKRLEVFLLPLDGMLVHHRSLPRNFVRFPQQIAGTHLYTWVERGTVRVKCLAQEHNTLSPARARTRTARSGVERTSHEATAPPTLLL